MDINVAKVRSALIVLKPHHSSWKSQPASSATFSITRRSFRTAWMPFPQIHRRPYSPRPRAPKHFRAPSQEERRFKNDCNYGIVLPRVNEIPLPCHSAVGRQQRQVLGLSLTRVILTTSSGAACPQGGKRVRPWRFSCAPPLGHSQTLRFCVALRPLRRVGGQRFPYEIARPELFCPCRPSHPAYWQMLRATDSQLRKLNLSRLTTVNFMGSWPSLQALGKVSASRR